MIRTLRARFKGQPVELPRRGVSQTGCPCTGTRIIQRECSCQSCACPTLCKRSRLWAGRVLWV